MNQLRTLDLNALGPLQIKTLDSLQRQAERRARQATAWNDTVSLNLSLLGAITPKNRAQWEASLIEALNSMHDSLPIIQQ